MRRDPRGPSGRHASTRIQVGPTARPRHSRGAAGDDPDTTAYRDLEAAHGDALRGYALRLTGGDEVAADQLVTLALCRAWQDPQREQRRPGSVRPWLMVLVRAAYEQRGDEPGMPRTPTPSTTIRLALDSLSARHREVLVDLFYGGVSIRDEAARLGVPVATVKSRLFYALRALQMALERQNRP
jgi:RNA polymerase sigma-70 factor, ECF subfamily